MPLYLDTGHHSSRDADRKERSCLIVVPSSDEAPHGSLLAVADGVTDHPNPDTAGHDALKALGAAYYATPENWALKHALQESAVAANQALLSNRDEPGRAAALSALVVRRRRWAIAHAGHTRAWLIRDNQLKMLTRDHVEPRMQRAPRVLRACGLEPALETDFITGEIEENDVFVLTTAGVHNALTGAQILSCILHDLTATQMAEMITGKAAAAGGNGNSTVCVVRIEQVPEESQADIDEDITALPAMAPPEIGDVVDDFQIERLAHKSSRYRLYKAVDKLSGKVVALKFPNPRDAGDTGFAERFLREEWIGRRVSNAHLVRTLALKKGRRTALYSVMAYPRGESLAKQLARHSTIGVREAVFIGAQLLEALAELHHQGIVHNDIRPQNIVIDKRSKNLMLLGLGSSHVTHTTDRDTTSGSRRGSFLAPELFGHDAEPTAHTDIYAAGVTIYRMLTGSYPYGKIPANGNAPHGDYASILSYRTEASPQLDDALRRACALDPHDRFESAEEFAAALERGNSDAGQPRVEGTRTSRQWNWEVVAIGVLALILLAYLTFRFSR